MPAPFLYKSFNDGASGIPNPEQFPMSLSLSVTFSRRIGQEQRGGGHSWETLVPTSVKESRDDLLVSPLGLSLIQVWEAED